MPFNEARMLRNEKMLKLFEVNKLSGREIAERFGMKPSAVFEALKYARIRREKAKETAE